MEFLDFKNYVAVNYTLIRKYGLHAAVLIGELASEARYWKDRNALDDGWFFSTVENVEAHTGLNAYYQREAMKVLQDAGMVEVKYTGLPRKRYVRVDAERIVFEASEVHAGQDQSSNECTTSGSRVEPLVANCVDDNKTDEQRNRTTKKERESFDSLIESFTDDDRLREALGEFLKYRKARGGGFTNRALTLNMTRLSSLASDPRTMTAIVYQTIEHGWSGFFPLKEVPDGGIKECLRDYDFGGDVGGWGAEEVPLRRAEA